MRFEPHCAVPDIVRRVPHLAFVVPNLAGALQGKQILIPPNEPSPGVRVAFILDDGAPVESLEFVGGERDGRSSKHAATHRPVQDPGSDVNV